ncbi:homolog of Synechocystis YCF37 [Tasmannia lanceolata]|uniref:homolog of Synechocystis YCF37 n=1 Tax=Tasmannia lanceolata TaxID=3420 RepID=UPI004064BC5C
MASTSSPVLHNLRLPSAHYAQQRTSSMVHASKRAPQLRLPGRRLCLFLLTASTVRNFPALAEDIPLFGLRKKLRNAEKEAEEILREGEEAVEKGIETAERGIITAEREIETAEKEIETAASFAFAGDLTQAGVVAAAEIVGVVAASSVVNGILGSEG